MKGEADGSIQGQRGNLRYLGELVEPGGRRPKERERVFWRGEVGRGGRIERKTGVCMRDSVVMM